MCSYYCQSRLLNAKKQLLCVRQQLLNQRFTSTEKKLIENVTYRLPKRTGENKSVFSHFKSESNFALRMTEFLNSFEFSYQGIKNMIVKNKEMELTLSQCHIPERAQFLGPHLAAAHFVTFRGGKARFKGQENWIQIDPDTEEADLPKFFDENWILEALDCSKMPITYEGLQNIYFLDQLKELNLENNPYIDDWCLDRIAGEYRLTLEYINIRGCLNITEKGISSLSKLKNLKRLVLGENPMVANLELVCLMLEDVQPGIVIEGVNYYEKSLLEKINQVDQYFFLQYSLLIKGYLTDQVNTDQVNTLNLQ